nr:hypothetical protein REQ54_00014 [Rhizobium sp. Q54]
MRPKLLLTIGILLSSAGVARADLEIVLDRLQDPLLKETIEHSLNFPPSGDVRPGRAHNGDLESQRLTKLMRALGYLDAHMQAAAAPSGGMRLLPVSGVRYDLGFISVFGISGAERDALHASLHLRTDRYVGHPVRADSLLDIRRQVLQVLEEQGFPHPVITKVELLKDPPTQLAGMRVTVDAGERARWGEVVLVGARLPSHLTPAVQLAPVRYHPSTVDDLRAAIEKTGAFSRISLDVLRRQDESGVVDIHAKLEPRNKGARELAGHGLIGFGVLLSCCAVLAFRQTAIASSGRSGEKTERTLQAVVAASLAVGGIFALERLTFLIA